MLLFQIPHFGSKKLQTDIGKRTIEGWGVVSKSSDICWLGRILQNIRKEEEVEWALQIAEKYLIQRNKCKTCCKMGKKSKIIKYRQCAGARWVIRNQKGSGEITELLRLKIMGLILNAKATVRDIWMLSVLDIRLRYCLKKRNLAIFGSSQRKSNELGCLTMI